MVRFACASLSAEGFGDTDFDRAFSLLPEAGYGYIEFDFWHGRNMLPGSI